MLASEKTTLLDDLTRLARFGANVSDSHSCFIFLPGPGDTVELAGFHSLSNTVIDRCTLPLDAGLIGWVAKHGKAIHVSPFDRDSRTLGVYSSDQELKSFIAVPIKLPASTSIWGVVACDSRKSFAFSKLQGKLLEELAEQATCLLRKGYEDTRSNQADLSWEHFLAAGSHMLATVGAEALELIRIKPCNIKELEQTLGIGGTLRLLAQVTRLIQQALPPATPICRLANGDLLITVDNMMVSFYESRIEAIAGHALERGQRVLFDYEHSSSKIRRWKGNSFEEMVNQRLYGTQQATEKTTNEYRRAQ